MKKSVLVSVLVISSVCAVAWAQNIDWPGMKNLPRLPQSRLLVGYPASSLMVTGAEDTRVVYKPNYPYGLTVPTMSPDGDLIATARLESLEGLEPAKNVYGYRVVYPRSISTYSLQKKVWTDYRHSRYEEPPGNIAIAPDGSALAFALVQWDGNDPVAQTLHVIDLKSGIERQFEIQGRHAGITVSWSPDGRYLVYDTLPKKPQEGATKYSPEILILDLETGKSRKIATGNRPSWSPSGEWIAYYYSPDAARWAQDFLNVVEPPPPNRVMLVRPDGTDSKLLAKGEHFMAPPVWSPDSKSILLSMGTDMMWGTVDVKLVDIATRKVTRIVKDGPPVFGWAQAN